MAKTSRVPERNLSKSIPDEEKAFDPASGDWQTIITAAILAAEEKKAKERTEREAEARRQWQARINFKEYTGRSRIKRFFVNLGSVLKMIFVVPFMRMEGVKGNFFTVTVMKMVLTVFWILLYYAMLLLSFGSAVVFAVSFFLPQVGWEIGLICLPVFLIGMLFSSIFRMAGAEVDNIRETDYLFGLTSVCVSIFSTAVAVVAVIIALKR